MVVGEADMLEYLKALQGAFERGQITSGTLNNCWKWLSESPYVPYRHQIQHAILSQDWAVIEASFWQVLPFGTGGRRGPMSRFGSATINSRTIAESVQGLADYTRQSTGKSRCRGIIAFDTRHRSEEFARLSAGILIANGFEVFLCESPRPTPELSFGVRFLKCDIGIMISASHNPPSDNGFKAYWSDGGQILPPHDRGVINAVEQVTEIPTSSDEDVLDSGRLTLLGVDLDQPYVRTVAGLSLSPRREIRILFTPLHGVGEANVYRCLRTAGFRALEIYEPQRAPDGNFENVPDHLPNPERPVVFHSALEAAGPDTDLVFATDPDADRLGVAARNQDGSWRILNGHEVGALITDYVIRKRRAQGALTSSHFVIKTFVTTELIAKIAQDAGVRILGDLPVGFKYIGQAIDLEGPGQFLLGCEDSLGYLSGTYARDKDAATAALFTAELASELKHSGRTLADRLRELHAKFGVYKETLVTFTCEGATGLLEINRVLEILRTNPPPLLGRFEFNRITDYASGELRSLPDLRLIQRVDRPKGNFIRLEAGTVDSSKSSFIVTLRPSGTEPKLKLYFASTLPSTDQTVAQDEALLENMAGSFQQAILKWLKTGGGLSPR